MCSPSIISESIKMSIVTIKFDHIQPSSWRKTGESVMAGGFHVRITAVFAER
jgi:hypothetical protein